MLTYRERLEDAIHLTDGAHRGLLVAIRVPEPFASRLAVPGGEPPATLHVTLTYAKVAADFTPEEITDLRDAIEKVAARSKPFDFRIAGPGRFPASEHSDGLDVLFAQVESAELRAFRSKIYDALTDAGAEPNHDFVYTPHVTLQYVAPEVTETPAVPTIERVPVTSIEVHKDGLLAVIPLGRQLEIEAKAVERLKKLPTVSGGVGTPDMVRSSALFRKPKSDLQLPLNRKTTENRIAVVQLEDVEPLQEFVPVSGLTRYISQPRRDPPDVVRLAMAGKVRWVLQEGHTRVAAALLRGETSMEMRIWEFEQNPAGQMVPVPRGMHRRGLQALSYREKLELLLLGDDEARKLTDDEDERIDMPDIADVQFPSMIGAIPSKPPRKRKRTKYKGVTLGRRPTAFEAFVLSLSSIPRRYDVELNRVVEELATVRREHLSVLLSTSPERRSELGIASRSRTADVLAAAQDRMARYGVVELRNECRRQGLQLADLPEHDRAFDRVVDRVPVLKESVRLMADTLHADWMASLDRIALKVQRTKRSRDKIVELAEPKIMAGLKNSTRHLLHESFGVPRAAYMQALASVASPAAMHLKKIDEDKAEEMVDYVIQSAVMDTATCDPCADADGLTFEYDDPEVDEYAPPYVNCLGGDNCRCVQIYVLKDGTTWVVREDRIV